jgi:hypothetical protein
MKKIQKIFFLDIFTGPNAFFGPKNFGAAFGTRYQLKKEKKNM